MTLPWIMCRAAKPDTDGRDIDGALVERGAPCSGGVQVMPPQTLVIHTKLLLPDASPGQTPGRVA